MNNYRELRDAAKTAPDAVAYKYEGEQVTYKDLLKKVDAVIADEIGCKAIITVNEHYGEISKAIAGLDQPAQIILADVNIKKPKSKIRKSILRRKM